MASRSNHGSPRRADLFTGLKFWLSHQVPMKLYYRERLLKRGATIVAKESLADICIVDDARKNLPTGDGYYSYKFVDESLKRDVLASLEDHVVGTKSRADRQVGSVTVAAKGKRNPFTKEDDQILFNWLEPFRQAGGKWKGNDIYKQLEREHPQHTFQSWRHRYITLVEQGVKITVTAQIDTASPSDHEDMAAPQGRSPKRRRLNGTGPVNVNDTTKPSPQQPAPIRGSPQLNTSTKKTSTEHDKHEAVKAVDGVGVVLEPVTEQPTALEAIPTRSNTHDSVGLQLAEPQAVVGEDGNTQHHQMDGQSDERHDAAVSGNQQSITCTRSIPTSPQHRSARPLSASKSIPVEAVSNAPVFSRKEKKILYSIVPHIHSTLPQLLEESWNKVAARFGHHTPDEWRSLYQTAILPEYMSRNKLETLADLDDHTHVFLAEEQTSQTLKQEETKEEEVSAEEEASEDEASDMFFPEKRSLRRDRSGHADREGPSGVALREASPELGLQMILRAIEVKENGKTVAKDRHLERIRPLPPSNMEASATTPKKRLFGRTLDTDIGDSQVREQTMVTAPTAPDNLSFAKEAVASAFVSSNDQSFASSKRPPESGQRPPKSMTTSQEEPVIASRDDQENDGHISILDVLAATDRILEDDDHDPNAQRTESPTVNLLSDDILEAEDNALSPVLSDTGSEYVPFDTGPERSQLWDASQGGYQDEDDNDHDKVSEDEDFQIIQHATNDTPRKPIQVQHNSTRDTNSPHHLPSSRENDLAENRSRTEDETEDETEGEAEGQDEEQPDKRAIANTKTGPRIETQALFQQSFANEEGYVTEFEVPAPEGGWEQFGELEDDSVDIQDAQDIRTSVELPDHELVSGNSSMLSMTEEETPELVGKEDSLDIPLREERVVVSDNESDHTTFSEELKPGDLTRVPMLREQKAPKSAGSDTSEKTASSRDGSSPDTNLERDDAESATDDQATIELWFTDQPGLYSSLNSRIVNRLASTSLNATLFNLPAATFTIRDMVKSFEDSEATRRSQFVRETRIKREYTDSTPQPRFKPKTQLTEDEAKSLLPRAVIGVWTVEDDRDFLSKTVEGLDRVEKKHGPQGVKKRAKFLKLRYGEEVMIGATIQRSAVLASTGRPA